MIVFRILMLPLIVVIGGAVAAIELAAGLVTGRRVE